jgi:membrane protease YdiL (CAAX protease family)
VDDAAPALRRGPLVGVLAVLVVSNVMANRVLPGWAYVPWNLSVAAALVALAVRGDGRRAAELGLAPRRVPDGLRWGAAVSAAVVVVYLAALVLPPTRGLFEDDRADIGFGPLMWQALVVVPLGTVLMEEVAFRGVLPAMLRARTAGRRRGALGADLAAALLFGAWHVLPAWTVNEVNPVFRDLLPGSLGRALAVAGGVAGTAAAGMLLSWLRNRSGSLVAPILLHGTTNGLGYVLAWVVQNR